MRQLLAIVAVTVLAATAFGANHQGQRYDTVARAQQVRHQQPYALTGQAATSQQPVDRRDAQPRPR